MLLPAAMVVPAVMAGSAVTSKRRGPVVSWRRAREILAMLGNRSNGPNWLRLERDYLDRLLRGLY
jgi:hypothetical protein